MEAMLEIEKAQKYMFHFCNDTLTRKEMSFEW